MRKLAIVFTTLVVSGSIALGAETAKVQERLDRSAQVIREIMSAPDRGLPQDLLDKAVCLGVVPAEKKFAVVVGGSYGRGALVCRRGGTGRWGPASMIMMSGGSLGFQIGGESTDVLFIVMNSDGARKLIGDNVKLGADASVAAGPVGRTSAGATDLQLHAEILSYSRSRGLFGGISLSGAVVKQDKDGNLALYGREIPAHDILFTSAVRVPPEAEKLDVILNRHSPQGGQPFSD